MAWQPKPYLCALLFMLSIDMAAAQTFPLEPCTDRLTAGSPDCVLFPKNVSGADNDDITNFRLAVGEPAHMQLGIALSGGGSKAAPFGMGMLAGLSDSGLLGQVDAVSTVSGGSYAAYFYFNRLVARHKMRAQEQPVDSGYVNRLFYDCTYRYDSLTALSVAADRKINLCKGHGLQDAVAPARNLHQAFVRCRQDVVEPMDCNAKTRKNDTSEYGTGAGLIAATLLSLPFHHVANTLFDWAVNMSPTRAAYAVGLGSTYGLIPVTADAIPGDDQSDPLRTTPTPRAEYFANARLAGAAVTSLPYTFDDLQATYLAARGAARTTNENVPLWIVTSHAAKSRSAWGWVTDPERNFDRDIFEFTPFHVGSGRYGYWNQPLRSVSILDATVASAAFVDANAVKYAGTTKTGIALLSHTFNTDWGADIPNWNVSSTRRFVHSVLPVPFYWLDSALGRATVKDRSPEAVSSSYIRLVDGGNSENFGAYSLIDRGIKNIIIADAAQDAHGAMQDLCDLQDQLLKRKNLILHVPGLQDFDAHCAQQNRSGLLDKKGYRVTHWPYPVVTACVSTDGKDRLCADKARIAHRLFIVKPAIDVDCFVDSQDATTATPACRPRAPARTDLSRVPNVTRCAASKDDEQHYLPCETAGFVADNWAAIREGKGFPQHSTVFVTIDSSATLYGAYRELARHSVRGLGKDVAALEAKFDALLTEQARSPMPLTGYDQEKIVPAGHEIAVQGSVPAP